jgi:hypothetical protein
MNQDLSYELTQVMPQAVGTGLFSSIATFYDRIGGDTPQQDAMGQVDQTLVPVTGLQNIVCMFSVQMPLKPDQSGGRRTMQDLQEDTDRHLLLDTYYAGILARYLVNVDGDLYEITPGAVEHDSQYTQTRLAVRRFSL